MSFTFDPNAGLVLVEAQVFSSSEDAMVLLALDTGANVSVISQQVLTSIGYDLLSANDYRPVLTANGVVNVPLITLDKFSALGQHKSDFSVLCHSLPATAGIDGVIGLDFLRNHVLTLDFTTGKLTLV